MLSTASNEYQGQPDMEKDGLLQLLFHPLQMCQAEFSALPRKSVPKGCAKGDVCTQVKSALAKVTWIF